MTTIALRISPQDKRHLFATPEAGMRNWGPPNGGYPQQRTNFMHQERFANQLYGSPFDLPQPQSYVPNRFNGTLDSSSPVTVEDYTRFLFHYIPRSGLQQYGNHPVLALVWLNVPGTDSPILHLASSKDIQTAIVDIAHVFDRILVTGRVSLNRIEIIPPARRDADVVLSILKNISEDFVILYDELEPLGPSVRAYLEDDFFITKNDEVKSYNITELVVGDIMSEDTTTRIGGVKESIEPYTMSVDQLAQKMLDFDYSATDIDLVGLKERADLLKSVLHFKVNHTLPEFVRVPLQPPFSAFRTKEEIDATKR